MTKDVAHWTKAAADWIRWVRHPDHDAFWAYRSAFEAFVGSGTGRVVEIGAGEGRVSRCLGGLGYQVTCVEPVPEMLAAAGGAKSGVAYVEAPGHKVPLPDAEFDAAFLYNMLMDVEDLSGTLSEAVRLLKPRGTLVIGIVHPFADLHFALRATGEWGGHGSYFETRDFDAPIEDASGLSMHFRGCSRPLSAYLNALTAAGARVVHVEEPRPDPGHPWSAGTRWDTLPLFLWIKAEAP